WHGAVALLPSGSRPERPASRRGKDSPPRDGRTASLVSYRSCWTSSSPANADGRFHAPIADNCLMTDPANNSSVLTCPSCRQPMEGQDFERNDRGQVRVDLCFRCQGIWFDHLESVQLAPAAVVELFREIHA